MKEIERLLRAGIPAEELAKEIEEAKARIELEKNSTKAKENIKAKLEKNLILYFSIGRTEPISKEIEKNILKDFNAFLAHSENHWFSSIEDKKQELISFEEIMDWLVKNID